MNYEIIKIVKEGDREIAYVLEPGGKLIKVLVEDRTVHAPGAQEIIYDRVPTRPVPMPTRDGPHFVEIPRDPLKQVVVPQAFRPGAPMVPNGFKKIVAPKPELPDKPAYQPPPPGIAGVFLPKDTPGAATETRTA